MTAEELNYTLIIPDEELLFDKYPNKTLDFETEENADSEDPDAQPINDPV